MKPKISMRIQQIEMPKFDALYQKQNRCVVYVYIHVCICLYACIYDYLYKYIHICIYMFLLLQYYIYGVFSASKRSSTSFWGFFFLGSGGGYNRWKCVLSTPLLRKSASWEKNLADICGYGGTVTCSGWRAPRTSTTISWCDGELGPLFDFW